MFRFTVGFLAIVFSFRTVAAEPEPADRPNVILIMADDLGYECIGANGGTSYRTPHLDRLAAAGVRFDHCFAQPLCTPTRVQIMTGQSNVRNYVRFGFLDPDQTTFAHLFRKAGYATAIVGKWQLDHGFEGPAKFGFDEHCLWQLTRKPQQAPRYVNPGLEINGKEVDFESGEYGPDLICDYAMDFIERHRRKPFLLYYPMILTHSPYQPTPGTPQWDPTIKSEREKRNNKRFADMTTHMDLIVGRIVAKLRELDIQERTLVMFLGDNGTGRQIHSEIDGMTVRGAKGQVSDGGMRVPLIVAQPGAIPAGQVCSDLVDTTDFLPTICDAAGVEIPAELPIDGRSFLPQLRGEEGNPRSYIYCWYAPRRVRFDEPSIFARTHRYRLDADGRFFALDTPKYEQTELNVGDLTPEAAEARDELAAVLDKYRDARPKVLDDQGRAFHSP